MRGKRCHLIDDFIERLRWSVHCALHLEQYPLEKYPLDENLVNSTPMDAGRKLAPNH